MKNSYFNYAKIDELDASAVELKYANSTFAFVIVLPNSRTGLPALEIKMKDYGLANVMSKMTKQKLDLRMPKFKVDYTIDLSDPLKHVSSHRFALL